MKGTAPTCFDWNYGGCTGSFNQGREYYAPSQIRVSGGAARLVAEPTSPPIASGACQNGSCTYLSGLLSTARPRADNGSAYLYTFTYGYVEARMRLSGTQGFFTAWIPRWFATSTSITSESFSRAKV